jgi:hypothetical protein
MPCNRHSNPFRDFRSNQVSDRGAAKVVNESFSRNPALFASPLPNLVKGQDPLSPVGKYERTLRKEGEVVMPLLVKDCLGDYRGGRSIDHPLIRSRRRPVPADLSRRLRVVHASITTCPGGCRRSSCGGSSGGTIIGRAIWAGDDLAANLPARMGRGVHVEIEPPCLQRSHLLSRQRLVRGRGA